MTRMTRMPLFVPQIMLLIVVLLFLPLLSLAKTSDEGLAWMAENAKLDPIMKSSFGGYQYKLLQEGHGVVSPNGGQSYVRCHYEGRLTDGTIFESTYLDNNKPKDFRPIDVHDGWFATLLEMVEGDIYELVLPSELTVFGEDGSDDGKVKGGAVVIYKLEMVQIIGQTRSALNCNVTQSQHCNSKEQSYIRKQMAKPHEEVAKDLKRHSEIVANEELEPKVKNWTLRRIHILQQIVQEKKKKTNENKMKEQDKVEQDKKTIELKCRVSNPTEHCNAKELDYIEKVLQRRDTVLTAHLEQATTMLDNEKLEADVEDWTRRRIHILNQVIGTQDDKVFSMTAEL